MRSLKLLTVLTVALVVFAAVQVMRTAEPPSAAPAAQQAAPAASGKTAAAKGERSEFPLGGVVDRARQSSAAQSSKAKRSARADKRGER